MKALLALTLAASLAAPGAATEVKKFKRPLPRPSKAVGGAKARAPKTSAAKPVASAPAPVPPPPPPFTATPAPAPQVESAAPPPVEGRGPLAAAGLALEPVRHGSRLLAVLAQSPAQSLGLRAGDALISLDGRRAEKPQDAAEALARWRPGARETALIERDLSLQFLSGPAPSFKPLPARSAASLTPLEERLRAERLRSADASVPQRVAGMRAPPLRVPAGLKLWIRFPKGIPVDAKSGDVLEGVTSAAMATDSRLDFLGVPAGSQVWAQVVSASPAKDARLLKLHLYKVRLKGGHVYALSAILTDVSGDPSLLKATPGGTLVASPADDDPLFAGPERDYQATLLKPLEIYEAPEFYPAGPGLWLKTVEDGNLRRFELTHAIAKRSAETAGLKAGDRILEIDGTAAAKLEFSEAVSRLYGPVGSTVKLKVLRAEKGEHETLALKRGVFYRRGSGIFAARTEEGPVAGKVLPDSPAAKAGVREGDRLLKAGELDLAGLDDKRLAEVLQGNLSGPNALMIQSPGKDARTASFDADLYPTAIRPDALLSRAAAAR